VSALDLIRARGAAAQICVLRDGEVDRFLRLPIR
jgi:hypothetical protein